jgi:hypothetical protein
MGDRIKGEYSHQQRMKDMQTLLESGINKGELRDEILLQLVKQLRQNPRP